MFDQPQIYTPEQALTIAPREPRQAARARREKPPTYDWRFWAPFLFGIGALVLAAGAAVALRLLTPAG